MTNPHINTLRDELLGTLRDELLGTLRDLRNRANPMEPDRARAIAQVAGVLVDSARVEVDYLKATGQDVSNFIDGMKAPDAPQAISQTTTGTLHRLSDGRLVHRAWAATTKKLPPREGASP